MNVDDSDEIYELEEFEEIVEKQINHPLETTFDIEQGSTMLPAVEVEQPVADCVIYDDKDAEIDKQLQELYNKALSAYETQMLNAEMIEPKYKARAQEVAVQMLNTALATIKEKRELKQHKDKHLVAEKKASSGGVTNNNLIVTDRNDLLKLIKGSSDPESEENES